VSLPSFTSSVSSIARMSAEKGWSQAVAQRVGDDLQELRAAELAVDPLERVPLRAEHGLVQSEQRERSARRSSSADMLCLLYRVTVQVCGACRGVNDASARRNLSCPSTLWRRPPCSG